MLCPEALNLAVDIRDVLQKCKKLFFQLRSTSAIYRVGDSLRYYPGEILQHYPWVLSEAVLYERDRAVGIEYRLVKIVGIQYASPYIIKAVFFYRLCRRRFRGIAEDAVADADVISLHSPLFKQRFPLC